MQARMENEAKEADYKQGFPTLFDLLKDKRTTFQTSFWLQDDHFTLCQFFNKNSPDRKNFDLLRSNYISCRESTGNMCSVEAFTPLDISIILGRREHFNLCLQNIRYNKNTEPHKIRDQFSYTFFYATESDDTHYLTSLLNALPEEVVKLLKQMSIASDADMQQQDSSSLSMNTLPRSKSQISFDHTTIHNNQSDSSTVSRSSAPALYNGPVFYNQGLLYTLRSGEQTHSQEENDLTSKANK